jgi:hypothetical protein
MPLWADKTVSPAVGAGDLRQLCTALAVGGDGETTILE